MSRPRAAAASPAAVDAANTAATTSTAPPTVLSAGLVAHLVMWPDNELISTAWLWPSASVSVAAARYSSPGTARNETQRSATLLPISPRNPLNPASALAQGARPWQRKPGPAAPAAPGPGPHTTRPGTPPLRPGALRPHRQRRIASPGGRIQPPDLGPPDHRVEGIHDGLQFWVDPAGFERRLRAQEHTLHVLLARQGPETVIAEFTAERGSFFWEADVHVILLRGRGQSPTWMWPPHAVGHSGEACRTC